MSRNNSGLRRAILFALIQSLLLGRLCFGADKRTVDIEVVVTAPNSNSPVIVSFDPSSGLVGSVATLFGGRFVNITQVAVNGTEAPSFTVVSEGELLVEVPPSATSGPISVTNKDGTGLSAEDFTVVYPPRLDSFIPASGPIGTEVTIVGSNYTDVTSVLFNGVSATYYEVDSSSQLRAAVPAGAITGKISVTAAGGTGENGTDFTVTAAPRLLTFTAVEDAQVKLSSPTKNYGDKRSLKVRESKSAYRSYLKFEVTGLGGVVQSAKVRLAVTNSSPDGGSIYVVSNEYEGTSTPWLESGLNAGNAPAISGSVLSSPGAASNGATVEFDVTAAITADAVYSFGIRSSSRNTVAYSSKESDSPPELVVEVSTAPPPSPAISNFSPSSGPVGTEVTIDGANLGGASLSFNGVVSSNVTVVNDSQLRADVPPGASSGKIEVMTPGGMAESSGDFTVTLPPPPTMAGFSPALGPVGTDVTISGAHFTGSTAAYINGTTVLNLTVDSDVQVRFTVPDGAASGKIRVTTPFGSVESVRDFEVEPTSSPPPLILSFTPVRGKAGSQVTIDGSNLSRVSEVKFAGISATTFSITSDTELIAEVPAGAETGGIAVISPLGAASSSDDFEIVVESGSILVLRPTDDAFVRSSKSKANYGDRKALMVKRTKSSEYVTFLKFAVPGLSGDVTSARMRLYVTSGSDEGGSIYLASNQFDGSAAAWNENELTWENAPVISTVALSFLDEVAKGREVELDLTSVIVGPGVYSFALKNNLSDAAKYSSKESKTPPELVIETGGGTGQPGAPTISSFTPSRGAVGTAVTIRGRNFDGTNAVMFGGAVLSNFSVSSATTVLTTLPAGASTGKIRLTTPGGAAESIEEFVVEAAPPKTPIVGGFTPGSGPVGTEVTVEGSNFTGATGFQFNGVTTTTFSIASDSRIIAAVPPGATSGRIGVENKAGVGLSEADFTVSVASGGTFTFEPTDDAFVWPKKKSKNYGDSQELRVRNTKSAVQLSYAKFAVSGIFGTVLNAKLRLLITDSNDENSRVYLVSNNYQGSQTPWDEQSLTWVNAPKISEALHSVDTRKVNAIVEFDITQAVLGNGMLSFAMSSGSADALKFSSKEGALAPQLVIQTATSTSLSRQTSPDAVASDTDKEEPNLPQKTELGQNYPNPFNPSTTINFALPKAGNVTLTIYNLRGQLVRTLVSRPYAAGRHKVLWDGHDMTGVRAASGVYVYRLQAVGFVATKKLTLMK